MRVPSPPPRRAPVATAPPPPPSSPGAAETDGLDFIFAGYLVLVAIEFGGLGNDLPVLKVIRFTTILNWLLFLTVVYKGAMSYTWATRQGRILLGYFALTVLSVAYAEVQMRAYELVRPTFESIAFAVTTMFLIDRRVRLDKFALLLAVLAPLLVARNLSRLGGSTRAGAFSAPYFMGDGNDFAWGLIVMLPIIAMLILGDRRLITRLMGLGGVGACILGIVGTQSRGGTLGLAAAFIYGWWFVSKRRALGAAAVVVVALGVVLVAPNGYFARMQTVTEYEEDNSAQARLQAWGAAIRMAADYPLGVGAGNFNSAYGRHYNDPNNSRVTWGAARWISAHSIYFKILGEFGFLGLAALLWLIGLNIRDNRNSRRILRLAGSNARIDPRWPSLMNMSTIGFAVAGAFLTGISYPHVFLVTALTLAMRRIVELEHAAPVVTTGGAPVPATQRVLASKPLRVPSLPRPAMAVGRQRGRP